MKLFLVGVWAVCVTLGAGYAVASWKMQETDKQETPRLEGLRYTSLPTISVPVVQGGQVTGYVVVRMVYTADAAVLRGLASEPDPFITDEIFRSIYGNAEASFGKLARFDLASLAEEAKVRVNERMGAPVVEDLLVDGLNYIDLTAPQKGMPGAPAPAPKSLGAARIAYPSSVPKGEAKAAPKGGGH
ncbi:hypothetical protein L1787_03580 [Acuticoccus sp. M5D2P5]|uniref:hypothetical protein n=1 Tax=Acuticoccus kalidii TaxID=2910977 RepID=UPI001F47C411|nr:hypothetical protein [Acuticoccus kalidii]MCF3932496.1 hypothetical protein [Acuticoccus kalidii]